MGGIVTWPYWSPRVAPFVQDYGPARPADGQIASLEDRIAELEQAVRQAAPRQDVTELQQDTQALREEMNTLAARLQDVEPGVAAAAPEGIDQYLSDLRSEGEQIAQRLTRLDAQITGLNEQVADFDERITSLDERVTSLDERVAGMGEQLPGLGEQVTGLNEQVTGLGEQVTGLDEQVRNLSQQIEATHDVSRDAAAVALGLSRLSETIGTSRAYREELDAFKNIADRAVLDDESLQLLETYAGTGVSTFADLYRRYPEMAEAVTRADVDATDGGPLQTAVNRVRSLVSVRRTGEAAIKAGGVDAALEVARSRLEVADLPGAINALDQLEGAPAQAAAWWLNSARSRLAVQQAMERMQIRAISTLSSKEG